MDYRRGRDMAEKAHGPGVHIGQVYLNLTKDQRKIFTNTNFYLAHLTLNSKQQIPQNERALKLVALQCILQSTRQQKALPF